MAPDLASSAGYCSKLDAADHRIERVGVQGLEQVRQLDRPGLLASVPLAAGQENA